MWDNNHKMIHFFETVCISSSQLCSLLPIAGSAPRWRAPVFIPWSHYCLRLRCPCSLWFVGNELAPPCPCSIILIEKVISHSTEQIGEGESVNSNQELTCSQPAARRRDSCPWYCRAARRVVDRGARGTFPANCRTRFLEKKTKKQTNNPAVVTSTCLRRFEDGLIERWHVYNWASDNLARGPLAVTGINMRASAAIKHRRRQQRTRANFAAGDEEWWAWLLMARRREDWRRQTVAAFM